MPPRREGGLTRATPWPADSYIRGMSREYSVEEIHRKLHDPHDRFFLIDTLPKSSYEYRHIPGSLSVPVENLPALAPRLLPDKDAEVIAYCTSPT